ncbi:MAG: CCA tRNA nucleotidyltransferase [Candidatus Micrarchaeota archaeon]
MPTSFMPSAIERSINSLSKRVDSKVKPSKMESKQEKKIAADLLAKLSNALGPNVNVIFIGSSARDTGLKGDRDIDLFVAFPRSEERDFIVKRTIEVTRKVLPGEWVMHYAEHPYLQGHAAGYKIEVIPCFQIQPHEKLKSAVDRSPLHMDYLQSRLTQSQKRDVRVLKKFLKNAGVYGAELAVQGFSGLLCEYLILNYRSFFELVENARKWVPQVVIDLTGEYQSGFDSPLVLIDAIDKNRNAGAVVSETNLLKFISLCHAFYEKPSMAFFFSKRKQTSSRSLKSIIKKRGTRLLLLEFDSPDLVEDITVPQLQKTQRSLAKQLELAGYSLLDSASFLNKNKAFALFEFSTLLRPPIRILRGPPAWHHADSKRFAAAHKKSLRGPFIKDGRLVAESPADKLDARQFLQKALKQPQKYGVASNFLKPIKRAKFYADSNALKSRLALPGLKDYFTRREFWL